jgi:death-on-curing protein
LQQSPKFVTKEQVLLLYELQISRFGGAYGIVNEGLLDSAIAQPKATFFGEFLHREIHEQAAAYLYHLVGLRQKMRQKWLQTQIEKCFQLKCA